MNTEKYVQDLLAQLEKTDASLNELRTRFPQVMEAFFSLADQRNEIIEQVKNSLRGMEFTGRNMVMGPFRVSRKVKQLYNVDIVTRSAGQELLKIPGAIKRDGLDKAVLKDAVGRGVFPANVLNAAYCEEEQTPAVTGPKPWEFKS